MLESREIYCPSHFGNSYEVAGACEMRDVLAEAAWWGCDRFSDWFDAIDLYDPYNSANNPQKLYNFPEAMWRQKFQNYGIASELGLSLGICITPNHVHADQLHGNKPAVKGVDPVSKTHIFGQLLCPSDKRSRDVILRNQENLFRDFQNRGLRLASLSFCPYDYGGCLCEECQPWIVTFGKLCRDIADVAEGFFPGIEAHLIGWWWTADDHRLFTDWAEREAPGRFKSMAFHLPYDATSYDVSNKSIPAGCAERAFVHACYGDKVEVLGMGRHVYGHFGVPVAPMRMQRTVEFLRSRRAAGFMAYCEGVHVDVNIALLAGLSSGKGATAMEILREYAGRYFGGGNDSAWGELLMAFSDPASMNAAECRRRFDSLAAGADHGWRLRQLDETLRLFERHQEVMRHSSWTDERLAAAAGFWRTKECLYRGIWGLGVPRHIFQMDGSPPVWNAEFVAAKGRDAGGKCMLEVKEV